MPFKPEDIPDEGGQEDDVQVVPQCESCPPGDEHPILGVRAVPGMPYSAAICVRCHDLGVIPLHLAVANTICIGGLDHAADWWVEIVAATLALHGMSMIEFNRQVQIGLEEGEMFVRMRAEGVADDAVENWAEGLEFGR